MTVLSKNPVVNIIPGNNNGTFTFSFRGFTEVADSSGTGLKNIQVYVWDGVDADLPVQQIQGTDFSVTQLANESGQINFLNGRTIASGQFVIIYSDVPYTQEVSFPTNQPVSPSSVELMGDRLEMQIKQLLALYKTTVRIGFPPTHPDFEIIVEQPLQENSPIVYERVAANQWKLTTTAFTIPDFQQLATDAQTAAAGAATSATQAQTAANNAAQQAANAGASAASALQAATDATNAKAAAESAKTDALAAQLAAESAKTGAEAAQAATQILKTDTQAIKDATNLIKQDVQVLVSKVPDPTGQPPDQTILTDGNDNWKFGIIPIVKNLDTAAPGSSISVSKDPVTGRNFLNAGSQTITNTRQVSTVRPGVEGGVTTEAALVSHEARLLALERSGGGFPWGTQNGNTDFVVNLDADLVSTIGQNVLLPTNTRDARLEDLGALEFFSTGSSYQVPDTIGALTVLQQPFTIILGLYIDGNTPTPTVILTQSGIGTVLKIQYTATGLELSVGGDSVTWPVVLNEYLMYFITFDGTKFGGFRTRIDQGVVESIVLTDLTLTSSALTPSGFLLSGSTPLRIYRFALLNVLAQQSEADSFTQSLFNIGPTSTGTPLEFTNTPVGFTLSPTANLGPLSKDGTYSLVVVRDATTNKFEVKLMPDKEYNITADTTLYSGVSETTPLQIATANQNTAEVFVDNRTDQDLYLSRDSTDLAANPTKGLVVKAGCQTRVHWTSDIFAIAGGGTAAVGNLAVTVTVATPI